MLGTGRQCRAHPHSTLCSVKPCLYVFLVLILSIAVLSTITPVVDVIVTVVSFQHAQALRARQLVAWGLPATAWLWFDYGASMELIVLDIIVCE